MVMIALSDPDGTLQPTRNGEATIREILELAAE